MYCITSIHVQTFLTSIRVASQIHTRSRCTHLTSSHITYQIPLDQKNCISARSHSHLTISRSQSVCLSSSHSIASHSNPGRISAPYRHCLKPNQVSKFASSASSSCPTLIKVRRISYHLHPCTISLSSRSIDSHFTSIQVVSEFHPGRPD